MKSKLRVGILCGGKSAEHEISIQSARNIVGALNDTKYIPVVILIDKQGRWHLVNKKAFSSKSCLDAVSGGNVVCIFPGGGKKALALEKNKKTVELDIIFPVLHGPMGEDGTVQGLLKLLDIPFVGSGVSGSAIGMDKEITKRLLQAVGVHVGKFLVIKSKKEASFSKAKRVLGTPIFVKPANMGSSVGISKVYNEKEFKKAVALALTYDTKVILEKEVVAREIECSVLGNEKPIASVPGEIVVRKDFYSYEAKYEDKDAASLEIPANISPQLAREVREVATKVFTTLQLEGMARIDFFLDKNGELFVNEANTIPGFTNTSMYPKLWEASGISYSKLLDKLIVLAFEKYEKEKKLKNDY